MPQHYSYSSTATTVHLPQYYSYNNAHISTIQLQLRHDLLFPFQHGAYDAARLVHRLVHFLIFPLDDVLRELRQIEREIVFVGHRHVDTADLHTHTDKCIISPQAHVAQTSAMLIECPAGAGQASRRDLVPIRGKGFPLLQCFQAGSGSHQTRNGTHPTGYGNYQAG